MLRPPLVLIDMDGVLCDLESEFLARWRQRHPERDFVPVADRRSFYVATQYAERFGGAVKQDIWEILSEAGFYQALPPIPGAVEALREMDAEGITVRLCTSPYFRPVPCVAEKYGWVEEHLGFDWLERIIITKDKTLVSGDVLIDDKPRIEGMRAPRWRHVVFDAPYNRETVVPRLTCWPEWRDVMLPLLDRLS